MKRRTKILFSILVAIMLIIVGFIIYRLFQPNDWCVQQRYEIYQENRSIIYVPILVDENGEPTKINDYFKVIEGNATFEIINVENRTDLLYTKALKIDSTGNTIIEAQKTFYSRDERKGSSEYGIPSLINKSESHDSPKHSNVYCNMSMNPNTVQIKGITYITFQQPGSDIIYGRFYDFEKKLHEGWQEIEFDE